MKSISQPELQRLVDAELNDDQLREVLASAEDNPELWKQIALAFTEDQMWNKSFTSLLESGVSKTAPSEISDEADREHFSVSLPEPNLNASSLEQNHRTTRSHGGRWMAVATAAALVLTLTAIGLQQPRTNSPSVAQPEVVTSDVDPGSKAIEQFNPTMLAMHEPDHVVDVSIDGDAIKDVPLYDVRRFRQNPLSGFSGNDLAKKQAAFEKMLPVSLTAEKRSHFERSGGMLDERLEFISGRLDDGRSYVIPHRTIRFLPGQ